MKTPVQYIGVHLKMNKKRSRKLVEFIEGERRAGRRVFLVAKPKSGK